MSDDALAAADRMATPAVGRDAPNWALPLGIAGAVGLGFATFAAVHKPVELVADALPITTRMPSRSADLPPPPVLPPRAPVPAVPPLVIAAPPVSIAPPAPAPHPMRPLSTALIVDLGVQQTPAVPVTQAVAGETPTTKISPNEGFFDRVGRGGVPTARTDQLSSTDKVVPQGTIMTGVLETAIDSDLPGLVRAVVSRDVRGFDGTRILIPRGSRLIGQYSSGIALGQSRAFVIWTRVLRGDGVSIQLGSAATDGLGTAGLGGKVNNHFLRRFGAATLLSVVTTGLDYFANSARASQVVIGSTGQANQLASIALQREIDLPPTIKVPQGTPVRVFVARDLDFGAAPAVQQ